MITVNVEEQNVSVECVKKTYEVETPVGGPPGKPGEQGKPGEPGPPNILSIGTVTEGPADATITGEAPNQVLNLSVPPGRDGEPGPPNELSIGTVSTGDADATITGDAPNQVLNLTIPKGQDGEPGQPNTLTIGTVQQGAAGATITGTSPNQVLNLTLPNGDKGDTGNPTEFELRGTGSPQGVIAAPPGTYYTDAAGTTGAWRWIKASGTGTTGWVVLYGDTGWRNVTALSPRTFQNLMIKRSGQRVSMLMAITATTTTGFVFESVPAGFLALNSMQHLPCVAYVETAPTVVAIARIASAARPYIQMMNPQSAWALFEWDTADQWPAILPGTPA